MAQIDWDSVKYKVNVMLESDSEINAIPSDVVSLARMLLETGDNNHATRESLATSIRGMLKPYPGYPWRRGNQGSLPAAARAVVDTACEEIRAAAHHFFSSTVVYSQPLLRKHGKSKGLPVFVDADEYANTLAKKARTNATALFKSGEWDGTLSGLSVVSHYVEEEE